MNGFQQEGVSRFEMTVEGGYRMSSARAYLHFQPKRANLDMITGAKALRVPVEKGRATGVDLHLQFRGGDGLRIVDASVIPAVPSANINACTFMLAEKAADLILGRPALASKPLPYHKAI